MTISALARMLMRGSPATADIGPYSINTGRILSILHLLVCLHCQHSMFTNVLKEVDDSASDW